MKFVIQRVNSASVKVDGNVIGSIGKGYLILFGAGEGDTEDMLVPFADKICKMRIFADENGKTNLSINDVGGEMLIVSQFTLYADCRKGNRPSFISASEPAKAEFLYNLFNNTLISILGSDKIFTGKFKSIMKISLTNEGPFTLIIEK